MGTKKGNNPAFKSISALIPWRLKDSDMIEAAYVLTGLPSWLRNKESGC